MPCASQTSGFNIPNYVRDMLIQLLILAFISGVVNCYVVSEDDHWIRCVTNISVKYFKPGKPILMLTASDSSDNSNTNLETRLAAEIHEYPRWSGIFRIFTYDTWVSLAISVAGAYLTVKLVGRIAGHYPNWNDSQTVNSSLTNVWAVVLGVSVSAMPRTASLRLFFLTWVCFSLAVNTVFQCFLTTYLVEPGYEPPIKTIGQMLDKDIKVCADKEKVATLKLFGKEFWSKIENSLFVASSEQECLEMSVTDKNVSSFVWDAIVERSIRINQYLDDNYKPVICKLDNGLSIVDHLVIITSQGNPLLIRINNILARLLESGLIGHWLGLSLVELFMTRRKTLRRLWDAVRRKRPEKWVENNWFLMHDNAPAHRAIIVKNFLARHNITALDHPPYSPDLSPPDYFLFPRLKSHLKGRRFNAEEVIANATRALRRVSQNGFQACFQELYTRWQKYTLADRLQKVFKVFSLNLDYFHYIIVAVIVGLSNISGLSPAKLYCKHLGWSLICGFEQPDTLGAAPGRFQPEARALHQGPYNITDIFKLRANNVSIELCADKNSIKHTTMRVLLFQIIAPGIPLPPQPVLTRWETWLDAVNYYAEHYGKIMEVIDELDSTDSSAVAAVKSLPSEQLLEDILSIASNFKIVSKSIILLESSKLKLSEALNIMDKVSHTVIQNNNSLISEKVKLLTFALLRCTYSLELSCVPQSQTSAGTQGEFTTLALLPVCRTTALFALLY
ncbi:hypothetical protein ANN_00142 [Periplaneta americana]|uniref:Uncharacterized protein n=1 Tax=Periplaneta americana TaxID=6978 RepID=A0ABQ8TPY4_PERAM|nr:hypothetical protein ANN_00142 [Periplaneta americana]